MDRRLRFVGLYLGHLVLATVLAGYLARSGAFALAQLGRTWHIGSSASGETFYRDHLFLLNGIVGLVMGCIVAAIIPRVAALWVWIAPSVLLVYRFATYRPSSLFASRSADVVSHFFGSGCWIMSSELSSSDPACIHQVLVTAPVVASICYSVGAALEPQMKKLFVRIKAWHRMTHGTTRIADDC